MKKNGFTLSEVLVTLAIIGVIATLTLPSMMSNISEQQYVTAYKKTVNNLNDIGHISAEVDGFNFNQLTEEGDDLAGSIYDSDGNVKKSLWAMIVKNAPVDKAASIAESVPGNCNRLSQIHFKDGTVLCYNYDINDITEDSDSVIEGWIDVNGVKKPNLKSECTDNDGLCPPGSRTINDQFPVTLHGSNAYAGSVTFSNGIPTEGTASEDKAARWAMRK